MMNSRGILEAWRVHIRGMVIMLLVTLALNANAQITDKNKITVSYSYNFAKNIEWPNESKFTNFTIVLFDVQDKELANEFLKLNDRVSLKNVPVKVIQTRNLKNVLNANMVYVGNNEKIEEIQNIIGSRPILLITREANNKRLVMLNLFQNSNQAVKFEVNKANLINNNLKALPELILLGGTEIDVAKLYREGQTSLVNLQNQLDKQQNRLSDLQKQNNTQKANNEKLVNETKELNKDIENFKSINDKLISDLASLKKTIKESEEIIKKQKVDIEASKKQKETLIKQVEERNAELNEKAAELQKKQQDLESISQSIQDKESMLSELNKTIEQQQISLDTQKIRLSYQENSIEALDKLVNAQRWSLYFMIGLAFTTTALLGLGVFAYKTKREDNERLALRSHDLQVARDKLEIAKRKAEEANRAKSAFLSLMSHELRTPLQSIIGYTDLVIEDLKSEGDTIYSDQLIRVHSNGERLLELINNTLDLAKIEAGKMSIQLTPTHMNSLIEEAIGNIKPLLAKNQNTIHSHIDNNSHLPVVDHDKLLQIIVNLLSNATKFTKNGEITLTVHNQPDLLRITVSDTGVGLTDEQKKEIFGRFHQITSKEGRKTQGTGLGLTITQYFCEIMGGTISVEDNMDLKDHDPQGHAKGSSFIVEIPLPVIAVEKKFSGIDENVESDVA